MALLSSAIHDKQNPSPTSSHHSNSSSSGSSSHPPTAAAATFVQADATSFKQVVQMLTGSPETTKQSSSQITRTGAGGIPPIKKKPRFKLNERRSSLKNVLVINTLTPEAGFSQNPEMISPNVVDFQSLVLSPNKGNCSWEEEKAIAEKEFYLHPSPRSARTDLPEPRLLPLFPVTSRGDILHEEK